MTAQEAIEKYGLPVQGYWIRSAEIALAPYTHANDPAKATELVRLLSEKRP